jgi:hypothetical protein
LIVVGVQAAREPLAGWHLVVVDGDVLGTHACSQSKSLDLRVGDRWLEFVKPDAVHGGRFYRVTKRVARREVIRTLRLRSPMKWPGCPTSD